MNASDVSDESVHKLRSLLATHAHGFVEDERVMNIVFREPQVTIQERDIDTIEQIASELLSLIEWYQPKLADEFSDE
jgi:hypothetical protein